MKAHILIVEDERVINKLLKETFLCEGYTVSTASNGEEALELLRNQQPDLILLDLILPGIDGYEVIKRLRANPRNTYIPIIVLSGSKELKDIVRAFELGADDYITKPFQTDELMARAFARVRVQLDVAKFRDAHLLSTTAESDDKKQSGTIKIFYCYARKDKSLRDELENHLEPLRRSGLITPWHDREIQPGKEWKREIDIHLSTSDIILLLVSSNFMRSDYCYGIEMQRALERHKAREARVIPIILRPCDWKETPISKLQSLPTDGKPIVNWRNRDEAFHDVVRGIREVVYTLIAQSYKAE